MMMLALMYGMIPSTNTLNCCERAAREHVVEPEHRVLLRREEVAEGDAIDAGRRDEDAEPEDGQHRQREEMRFRRSGIRRIVAMDSIMFRPTPARIDALSHAPGRANP
jgi:hypothetical protein